MGKITIKTYREVNYPILIPFFKIGLYDFIGIFIAVLVIVFLGLFFVYIYPPITWGLYTVALGLVFVLFFYVRRIYEKTGKTDVIIDWFDYFLVEEFLFKGREDEEKG